MDFSIELIDWNQLWEVAGPVLIAGGVVIALGIILLFIINMFPRGILRDIVRMIAILVIVYGFLFSLITAAEIWGSN